MQQTKRIAWIDIAKAITIFLVVFGHTLRDGDAQKIVYSFHVATFFLLSGMTCKTDNIGKRIKNDALRLLVPYFSFGLISILVFTFLGNFIAGELSVNTDTSFLKSLAVLVYACPKGGVMKFNMPLWFLPCLFITKLMYYALDKIFKGKQIRILVTSCVIMVCGIAYTVFGGVGLPLNLNVAFKMLFFFTLGRVFFLFISKVDKRHLTKIKTLVLGVALLLVTAVVAYFTPEVDYASDGLSYTPNFIITTLTGSFGVCFVSMSFNSRFVEYIGKNTLTILVLHKLPIVLLQTVGPQKALLTQYNTLLGVLTAVAVALISIALCLVADLIIKKICPFLLGDFSLFTKRRQKKLKAEN